jgi:NAD(P)-dependent dehydrogenase (short-subunit alcohol dehydrogenase family)|tara:strand:+ start:2161 stop:3678 length:1518 start_codon:yes stop_codon:yes gene_type:complete
MDVAVVTGASSGLGLAISNKLLSLGFKVYGLGGSYGEDGLKNSGFIPINCDLADPAMVEHMAGEILKKETAISVLVNNAKFYPAESFTDGAGGEFASCLNINLLCPLILARAFLPGLQKVHGKVISISPATPETARGGPAGAATSGGLRWMQEVLFQQYRDVGVSFSTISPEPNRWRPADSPKPRGKKAKSTIDPAAISDAVAQIVLNTSGNLITEVVIRPERLTENGLPAMRELPYPKPQPIPYTVPRELIEAEEIVEREEEDQELQPKRQPRKKRARKQARADDDQSSEDATGNESESPENTETEGEESPPRRRRRRRGRRRGQGSDDNSETRRDEPRRDDNRRDSDAKRDAPVERRRREEKPAADKAPRSDSSAEAPEQSSGDAKPSRRRRRGRKPRPMDGAAKPGFFDRSNEAQSEQPKPKDPVKSEKRPAQSDRSPRAEDKPKKAAKKSAKKAAKKAATKATKKTSAPKKKTAKKAATKKAAKKAPRKKVARKAVEKSAE